MLRKIYTSAFILCILQLCPLAAVLANETPQMNLPLACTLGTDCWSVNYVDVNPGEEVQDFTCAGQSENDHKGTDFALRSMKEMLGGVDVLAAAAGTVIRVRDSEDDTPKDAAGLAAIQAAQKECGNGILIDHGPAGFPGLRTMYCHMKSGSIVVKPGDAIKAGQKIGQVGLSGFTEFPHVHFGVMRNDSIIDPYTGMTSADGCGQMKQSLWNPDQHIEYEPISIYDGGFRGETPDFQAIKDGQDSPQTLSPSAPALTLWGGFYGVRKGDEITLEIRDPAGKIFITRTVTQDKNRARQFYYTGRSLKGLHLDPGDYTGTIILRRPGIEYLTRTETITVR